jgi:hypothetical protein
LNLLKKVIGAGTSAALVASLLATAVAPSAFASTTVGSAGTVPVGGTSGTASTFQFCENTAGAWNLGGTISVTITDANDAATLSFTNATGGTAAPTIPLNPGGLGGVSIVSVVGNTVTVNVPTDDNANPLCFTIGNLFITASNSAATGGINATAGGTISASTYASSTTSAAGLVAASNAAGVPSFLVNVTSACGFVNVGTAPGPAGDILVGGTDTGAAGTSSMGASSTVPTGSQETVSGLVGTPLTTAGITTVTQANVPNCSATSLASPGTVGSAVTQTAASTNINPGQQNQQGGTTQIVETSAGVIAANAVLTFAISSPASGVTFSTAPTVTSSAASVTTTLAAPTGLAASVLTGVQPPATTYGSVAAGTYYFEVTAKDLTTGETTPSAPTSAVVVGTGGGAVVLNWTAVSGSIGGYNVYKSTALAGPYTLVTTAGVNPVAGTSVTISTPITTSAVNPPPTNTTSPAVLAPTGLSGLGETNVAGGGAGSWGIGSYYFEVTANNAAGETTASASATAAVTVAASTLSLAWGAVTGASSYNLYEATALAGPYVFVDNFASPTTGLVSAPYSLTSVVQPPTVNGATVTATGGALKFANGLTSSLCTLNFGAQSCSVTVGTAASTSPSTLVLQGVLLDAASTVPAGTAVNVKVTGTATVNVVSNTIAYVGRTIASVGAQPQIFIGFNGQNSGMITLTEAGSGFFQASGVNDAFGICINSGETFTYAPWAIVTPTTAGGLLLLNTSNSTSATQLAGTLVTLSNGHSCAFWSIYAASTVASTINIVGATATAPLAAGATNGPTLSVGSQLLPGTTQMDVLVGSQTDVTLDHAAAVTTIASNATRVYKSGVTVTALPPIPFIAQGATDVLGGNLQLMETLNGQFLANEDICVVILPRASNFFVQDTSLNTGNSGLLPTITTNYATTGLLASTVVKAGCSQNNVDFTNADLAARGVNLTAANSFEFMVSQQATNGLGQITINNIHYTTTPDAVNGPVQVLVFSENANALNATGGVAFQQTVSNATVGTAPAPAAVTASGTALGATKTGPFTIATKVAKLGKYVTWKFSGGSALVGKTVQIWVATKNSAGKWGAFALLTARRVDASGNAYFWWKTSSKAWISVRGGYLTSLSVATQARWL